MIMKKLLTLLLFACIFVTGCDKNSLKDAQSKLETAHNYTASIVVSIKGDFEKNDITYRTRNKVTIDRITGTAKINADITTNNETRSETYYIKTDKDNATTYKKVDGIYNATTEKKDQNSLYYITAFINENSEVLRKEHIDNKTCYVIVLKKDRIASFLSSYYDVSFINKDKISVTDDALIYIHVDKNNNIESIEAGDEKPYNVFDLNDGKDFIITLKFNPSTNKTSIEIGDAGRGTPLSEDYEKAMSWINDEKTWNDIYAAKTHDYIQIVADGEIPVFNKEEKKWVAKTKDDEDDKNQKIAASVLNEIDVDNSSTKNDEDDDLPF